ncbi:protein NRT1/ PTR FAMILY 3.1-like [Jatropha curcas]|uniref:protein NRT1/ PTR FAMILY 3.1-like n=1 Tax=Jatropha curcas TaxID=180498 RepID=UPI0018947D74|nr:protein NRT1/ PTR FAMILY 3.1-like [Jatropha curcas]
MDRSPRFGSIAVTLPMKTRFRYVLRWVPLTQPLAIESAGFFFNRARGQSPGLPPTAGSFTVSCSISLPDGGFFSPSLTVLLPLSVTQEYLALQGWSLADSPGIPRAPCLLGSERKLVMLSATGLSPSRCSTPPLRLAARRLYCSPTTPFSRFRAAPHFARRYDGNRFCFLFLLGSMVSPRPLDAEGVLGVISSDQLPLSIIAFVVGSPLYIKLKPGGSPLIRLAQVIVAAVKKRKIALPDDPTLLYQNRELDASISVNGRLLHTNQFKWLDKAAIVTKDDEQTDSKTLNLWRLATVHRVEELKSIIRMLPVWASGILLITASSHLHSFVIQQARTMDRHLSHSFEIPPASLSIFSILTMMIGLVLYERLFVPFARRFTGNPAGISCLQRMGIGFIVNIIATIISALIESKRKAVAAHHNLLDNPKAIIPISVFWLVPQFCLHGVAEVFMSVGHLEFLYHQSPESMRSTAAALYWITIAMGNYIGTLIVSLVHKYTGQENKLSGARSTTELIARCELQLAIRTEDGFLELAHPRGIDPLSRPL